MSILQTCLSATLFSRNVTLMYTQTHSHSENALFLAHRLSLFQVQHCFICMTVKPQQCKALWRNLLIKQQKWFYKVHINVFTSIKRNNIKGRKMYMFRKQIVNALFEIMYAVWVYGINLHKENFSILRSLKSNWWVLENLPPFSTFMAVCT